MQELVRDCAAGARQKQFSTPELDRSLIYLGDRSEEFFRLSPERAARLSGPHEFLEAMAMRTPRFWRGSIF